MFILIIFLWNIKWNKIILRIIMSKIKKIIRWRIIILRRKMIIRKFIILRRNIIINKNNNIEEENQF